jgi:HipA-like protein
MPEGLAPLAVWCFGRQAGALMQTASGIEFAYAEEWAADGMPPLSQSLPLDGRFDAAAAAAFFGGLLPEGEPRRQLARLVGVSESNDYSMLAMIAGDTAGRSHYCRRVSGPSRSAGMSSGSTTLALRSF